MPFGALESVLATGQNIPRLLDRLPMPPRNTLIVLALATSLLCGCGGPASGGRGVSPGSTTGNGSSSQLTPTPGSINFGSVTVGSSKSQNGTIAAGSANVTVSSASWNGGGFSLSGISFPVTVPAGQTVRFTATFSPQAGGSSNGQLSFYSDASNSPTALSLTGNGAAAVQHSVSLSWNASTYAVAGYNIYRGTQSSGPFLKLNPSLDTATLYTDSSVVSGQTYYYAATSVDANNIESDYSNIATALIP
jgi:hypothetical protein